MSRSDPTGAPPPEERRSFLRLASYTAGSLLLLGCRSQEPPPPAPELTTRSSAASLPAAPTPCAATALAAGLEPHLALDLAESRAATHMATYHHCAQATFLTLQELCGLPAPGLLKALTTLPGVAERGETCGAVTASLLALGLVHGRTLPDDATWRAALLPARTFCDRFVRQHGSTSCSELLRTKLGRSFDLFDPTQRAQYVAAGGPKVCTRSVQTAVRGAAELLLEQAR